MYDFSQHDNDSDAADDDEDDNVNVATDDDKVILPRTDEDTIILIVQDRLWFDDRDLLIETLDSLCERVNHHHNDNFADNRKAAVLHGAPLAILHAMRQKEDSVAIQIIVCCAIGNLARCDPRVILEAGGLTACLRALARFQGQGLLQAADCYLIGFSWSHREIRKTAFDQGGLKAATDAMASHKLNERVQRCGCYALRALFNGTTTTTYAKAVVDSGGIQAVIEAMENFRDDACVQQYGCECLHALAKSHDDYRKRIINTTRGLIAVAQARQTHKDNADLVRVSETANKCLWSCTV